VQVALRFATEDTLVFLSNPICSRTDRLRDHLQETGDESIHSGRKKVVQARVLPVGSCCGEAGVDRH
jgi:hypothetical protein